MSKEHQLALLYQQSFRARGMTVPSFDMLQDMQASLGTSTVILLISRAAWDDILAKAEFDAVFAKWNKKRVQS
jgi:hypothetical protein